MDQVVAVCMGGCVLPLVLLIVLAAPILALNEYRRTRDYWPHVKWLAWLRLTALEGVYLSGLAILLSTLGFLPLLISTDSRWDIVTAGVLMLSMLFFGGVQGLVAMERHRYGQPPRNPPT